MHMGASHPAAAPRGAWAAVVIVAGGLFLAVMSTTLVSVALPSIGADLRAGPADLEWIVDAYVLVYSSLLVAGGVIGDRHGRKEIFLLGVSTFGLGSLVTGLAPSVGILLVGRVVQGLGPALIIPGSLTIIRAIFENPRQRAQAIGLWSMASGLALAVGPALGGLLVQGFGWRGVFLFNVPLTVALVLLAAQLLPRLAPAPARGPFDWPGAFLTTAGLALLAFAVIQSQVSGWDATPVLGLFAAGIVALSGFVAWERRLGDPLVDVCLFLRPAFTAANAAGFVVFFAFVGAIVYFSEYFQLVQGHSPVATGLDLSAIGVAFAIGAPISGRLVGRVGPLKPMLAGLVLGGIGSFGLLRLEPQTGIGAIWWNFALVGGGAGICLTPMTQVAVSAVGASRAGMASAIHNALRQVGQIFGVAVFGAFVFARLPQGGEPGSLLDSTQAYLFVAGLHHALWVSGVTLVATAMLVALLFSREATHGGGQSRVTERRRSGGPPPTRPSRAASTEERAQ